jgi:hypothetical protein
MHVTALGPTGAGKSHALLAVADVVNRWTFALAAKLDNWARSWPGARIPARTVKVYPAERAQHSL